MTGQTYEARVADEEARCEHDAAVWRDCHLCDMDPNAGWPQDRWLPCDCAHHEGAHLPGDGCQIRGCPCWWWPR